MAKLPHVPMSFTRTASRILRLARGRLVVPLCMMLMASGGCSGGGAGSDSESDDSTGEVTNYGAPCEHAVALDDVQGPVLSQQSVCDSELCVFAASSSAPIGAICEEDVDCEEMGLGTCNENGQCNTAPSYIQSNSYCAQGCEENDDCAEIAGCSLARCQILETDGPYCCQKLCVCGDDVSDAVAAQNENMCSDPGTCS